MRSKRTTESDIVDVLLGQAEEEVEARIAKARPSDAQTEAMWRFWTGLTHRLKAEKSVSQTIGQNASRRVMARITDSNLHAASLPKQTVVGRKSRYPMRNGWNLLLGQ